MADRRTVAQGLAAIVTAALAGCSFTGGFGDGYRCGDGDTCPTGTSCVGGFCVAEAHDATPDDDALLPDADLTEARCGTMWLLQDSFDDGVSGLYWDPFVDLGATLVESGGHLAVQLGAGTGNPYAGYVSAYYYDLTDSAIEVQVSQVGGENTILEVRNSDGARAQLVSESSDLIAAIFDAPGPGERMRIPYDPVGHAYWRIREAGGTMFWEFSADRTTWTELFSEPSSFPIEHVHGVVSAGGEVALASEARFEDVNDGVPASLFCPTSTLVDSFDTAGFRPNWENWNDTGCAGIESGGNLEMSFTGVGGSFCGVGSRHILDLRDSEVVLDATLVPQATMFVSYFQVIRVGDDETHLEINREGTSLGFEQSVDGPNVSSSSMTYSATNHRYWRLRESDGTVFWDTSPDGTTWTNQGDTPAMFDLSQVRVIVGAGFYGTGSGVPTIARFGGVN